MCFNRKNAEQKNWRMIKKGKHFLFGCSLVFAVGATLATPTVHADSVEAKTEATNSATQNEPTAEATTYAAPAATSPVATEAVEANSATTVVSADKSQLEAVLTQAKAKNLDGQEASVKAEVAAAIAEAEALVANGSASQDQINQSVERLTHAVASVKEVTEAAETTVETTSEATTESSATPKVRSKRAVAEGTTRSIDETNLARAIVTKENFKSFFQEGGTASYDKSTGTIKLTDDVSGQVGSAYLRFKIDSGEAFTFTGKVDIGDKYEGHVEPGLKEGYKVSVTSTGATDPSVNPVKAGDKVVTGKAEPGSSVEITLPYGTKLSGQADKYGNFSIPVRDRPGGDGVGFVFHTGNVNKLGQSGASVGMGGINAAFGFKLDSWHNTSNPNADQNAIADPEYGGRAWESNAFGAFYSSNNAGKVTNISNPAALSPAPSGDWVDFKINYNGTTKEFTVTYGNQTWTTKIDRTSRSMTNEAKNALTARNATYALSFVGSTGSGTNLQRVQIEKFEFTAPQIVHMKFVDAKGNEIEASSAIPGDENEVINLSTQDSKIAAVEAKGYKLKRIDASKAPSYNEGNNTVTLTPGGQLLTYVFAPAGPTVTPTLQVGGVMTEPGIKSTDNTISGIGKKGATIKIAAAGKTIVDNVTVAEDGSWSATLPTGVNSNITEQDQLVPRDTLTVTQTINGEESAETEVKVGLGESVVQPSETSSDKQSIVAETTTVTLKVPHDAGIAYFDYPKAGNARSVVAIKRDSIPGAWTSKDESKAVVKSYSTDGFFDTIVLEMKEQIQPGKAKVVSNIKEDKYTSPVGWKEINVEAKPADTTPPAAPKVNPVTAASTAVTGTAEPGSTVEVTLPNGSTVSAKADQDGNFSVPVSGLEEGKTVSVTATDAAGNKSGATSVTVPDTTAPAAPTVNPVKAGATAITGTAEAGSTVEVTLPNGQKASAKAGDNGEFSIPVPALNADDKISVTATDVAKNTSTPTKVTVKETVRPVLNIPYDDADTQAIYVYSGETNNIELKVTDNSGKIVKAYLAMPADNRTGLGQEDNTYLNGKARSGLYLNAEKIKTETTATETSPAVIRVTGDIPKNTYTDGAAITRYLFAEDAAGNTSYEHVGANMDKGALGRIRFIWKPQSFKYTAVAPSTPITSNTVPEASAIEKAVKDANPTFSDKIESVSVDGTNVKVTYKDGSTDVIPADSVFTIEPTAPTVTPVKNPSSLTQPEKDAVKKAVETANKTATKVEVGNDGTTTLTYSNGSTATLKPRQTVSQADITAPNAPVVNPVKAGDTAVTGTAEAGSTVEVTLPDGTKATATADKDGNFSVPVSGLEEGQTVSVTAKDASNNTSTPTTATVAKADDKTAPDAPVVNPVKAGDTAVTGTAEAGSTVEVTLPDGTKATATADKDGNFSVPVSGLEEGQTVSVTAKDASNNTSTPTTATVAKADDKTAPDAPVVNPVKAGDKAVTGTAEAGSTVEVTLPDGTKATATADKDGNFSVPVSGLEEGQTVSVTAKDASNNTSTPTTATVAKADDKTAPDAPVVNPVKAGDTAVTGTAEAGSTVEVTLPDGTKATATADKDGNFSVPVSGLEEGQTVSVTAKDASNNTSTPTTATVAKADDKTAPDAPVVNPVKAGDTAVTGTAEAGSTVEVTLPDGTKATATADKDGNFSVPVSGLEEGQTVSVTAKDASNNTSTPTTATVAKADDKTAPDAPVVNPVKAGDKAVTGTAEAGSTVEVTLPDGTKATATADKDGNFSVPVSGLEEGQTVSVTAKDASNNTSTPTTATVAKADDKTAPDAPVVNPVKAGDTAVTGTAEAGSTVEVTLPDGTKATATADKDGNFSVPVSGLEEGQTVSVTAKDASNNTSTPTTATVAKADDKTAPDAPVVNPVKAGDTAVTGTAEAGSTVEVTLPDGTKATATADKDGNFSVPVSGLEEGQTVSVTAKDASNNTSTPTTATVAKADDKTAPDAPVVNPVKAGDTAVTGTAEAGSTVEVTLPDGTKATATADKDGNFSVPVSGLEEGQTVSVTAKDASNNTSTPTTATVAKADDKTAPDAPVVNPVKAGDTAVTGTAEAGSTVEVTLPDGTKATATADKDGNFSVPVSGLEEGQTVSVTAKDASNNTSTPTTATVAKADDKTAPDAPVVNPVKAGDTAVTGTAEAGSTVEVTLPDGTKATATADKDGNFSVPVSGLEEGQTVSVTAKDASNNTSTPTTATVAKADDKTAPDAPVVNPVKAGDKAVTGTAEAGSTVEVTLPDGTKATATADKDGNFSVPVSGLEEGQTVSVTAKDASNNTSTPTTATVAKADDKTAPDAPVVNPVKAGDKAVTGTAEAGSTVEVTLPDGTKATATADKDGNFSVPVSGLEEGQTVSVTAKDASNNTSTPTTATVAKADDKTAPDAPVVNPVKAGDKAVTGTAEAGSTVEVTLPDGTKATATADKDGNFSVPVSGLEEGQTVSVTAKDASNNTSTPTTATVAKADDKTAPDAPVVNPVKAGDKAVTGTAEAGSTVEVTLPDGTKATATADKDGNFSVPVSGLEEGQTVSVTAKDASNNTSTPTTATVAKADDKTAPDAPVVNPVKAGDKAVTGTAEAGSTVEVTLPDGTKATATADKDGNFSVPVAGLEEGQTVSVTAKDASNNTSTPTTATVAKADDKTAPDAPVVNPVKAGDTAVTGTAEAGSTVEVTLPDGTKATATADKDGNFSVPVSGLEEGQTVSVTAKDASNNTSTPTTATVAKADDKTAPDAPVVNPVKAGDKAVTGTAEAGSTVEVTLPDGTKATATADKDGNFSVPVSGLEEGQTVSVTAKDASNNTSTPTTATVAKADDKTAPDAPVVNPVKAGDTAVTGTAEAGSTVEVTLPDGTKATATADKDGNFSVPVSGLEEGQTVSVTAKDASNNTSTPTTATVAKADDKTAPDAPVVNPVKAGDKAVTGTAEAGSTVEVTLPDGTKATATADKDGNFSVPVAGLKAGDKVSVTATDAAGNKSGVTDATVAKADDKTAPDAPVVNPVKAGDKAVTGTAEAGSTVEVTLPDGTKATATADKDGNFSVPVSGLEEGQTVSVTAKDASNNTSTPTTATVAKADDKTAPDAPVVNPVKAGDTAVTGTAEAGSTVEVTLPDGTKATATADKDGNFSVPVSGLEEGQTVSVTAKDASNNTSTPTTATVAKADDKTAPDAPVVNPVKAGDKAVTGTAEAGSTVEVTLPDGTKATATADKDGNFSVPVSGLEEGQTVSVTAKDASNNTSTPTTATVAKADDKTAPDAPVVNPVKAGDKAVTGTAEAGSTVEVTLPDGTKATATADKDGNFSVPVSGLEEGQTVSVTAKDASNNTSTPTTATVAKADDKTAPDAPVVNPVKAGDKAVTGTAEAGSTVEVTLPDGTKATATADKDGNFSVPVSGLEEGQTVSVTAKDASNNTSTPTTATVAKADDKTAPDAPVVNPVKAGDKAVTGTAEAGSTVEVTLPDGTKATATADKDGNFSVPVSGLEEGQTVSVTAKDASNNTSTPTTATVAKADDKTAPDAPVVNPVKAGDKAVTGTAEAGSTVEVTLPDGTKATATADKDGNFSVPVSGLEEGQTVSVTAKDASNNTSTPSTATVAKADDKTAPDAPVVNPVKAGDKAVTGTAEAGSTVEVTLPDGTKATATADKDGNFSVPVSGLEEGQTVSVTAKDASNNTSTPTTATVAKADDKTAPDAPVVNPVKAGDKAVTGTAEAGSTVEVTLPDGTKATATADKDGNFSVPVSGLEEGQTVSVTAKDASNNTSTPTTATVAKADDKTAPDAPVVNPVKAGDKAVTGTAEAGSTVEVTLPDGTKATATADKDGNFSVPVSGLEEGQTVSVTAKDASNNTSTPTTATVAKADDKTAPNAPVVNPVKAGDTAVTGTAEAGSTVEVTLPNGTKATATADKDGNFSVPVSGLEEGQTVSVTAKDASNNTSTPTTATVAKADDKTAPDAPVVNPVKAGDKAVTGTAEAGSTVEVTLPDGTKATATADKDGNFSVPVSGLEEGQTVSVTAKDASNNTSTPTEKTVGKGDGKDADNVKVPALTPVVDPNNLTDAEKAKVAEEVKKANPTATDVKVNNDGSVVVTFADGSVATIAANKVVKEATKESSAQAPSKKAGAKELPNTGTKQSNASLGLALLAAVTGGLLISKKRKEEE